MKPIRDLLLNRHTNAVPQLDDIRRRTLQTMAVDPSVRTSVAAAAGSLASRIVVIGGGQLYAQALPLADWLLLTEIDADLPGDTRFPAWDRRDFNQTAREDWPANGPGRPAFAFVTYQRQR